MLSTFLISLNSVLIIITVIIIGFLIGKSRIVSQYFINDVSTIVVNVALPISVFISSQNYITKQNFNTLLIGFILSMISIGLSFWLLSLLVVHCIYKRIEKAYSPMLLLMQTLCLLVYL
ncbi:hypothetical protein [uncultured Weissella sp.]|uniref:hypothetical protein n=1 Tax=uncultured Weissella sp. TaxID=253243 RepID=UPI00258D1971|nr:hypothetical protein [uncultured Weissella sp.]